MALSRNSYAKGWTRPVAGVVIAAAIATNTQTVSAQPQYLSDEMIANAEGAARNASGFLQSLVAQVSARERSVSDLELRMGALREDVNKTMVDLQTARDYADLARQAVDEARNAFASSQKQLREAQLVFNDIARAAMRQGNTGSPALQGAQGVSDALNRAAALRREADKQRQVVDRLDKIRAENANAEADLRAKKNDAEKAESEASQRQVEAQNAFDQANTELQAEQADYDKAVIERDKAKAALDAARNAVETLNNQRSEWESEKARREAEDAAAQKAAEEAASKVEQGSSASTGSSSAGSSSTSGSSSPAGTSSSSSSSSSDSTSSSSEDSATSTSGSASESSSDSASGSSSDSASSSSNERTTSSSGSSVKTATPSNPEESLSSSGNRSAQVEQVISRAMAQLGQPYAWGGGNANGPTKGIRDGGVADAHGDYNKVGFDCSGLTLYAFAAVGISLPHYTGYQYQKGTHYPTSQMQRGDLLFWGPNGHGHVAIYLGDGTMIEAPQSGSVVKISPVRYNGMTPNVVRLI